MSVRLILFDLDGTLVNTGGAGLRAFDRAMERAFGEGMRLDALSPAGMTDPAIFRELFRLSRKRSPTKEEERRLFDLYLEFLREEVDRSSSFRVMPGVGDLLEELSGRDGILLGLGTGNLESGARIKLDRPGLNGYFSFGGFGSDSSDRSKLLRIAVRRGMDKAGRDKAPGVVFVVGDTPRDVAAGKAIGARTLAVASGPFDREALAETKPDLFLDDLTNVPFLLKWFLEES